jgi:LemA protein
MGWSHVGIVVAAFAGVGLVLYVVITYNELVRLRNDSDRAWANIDVLLKQRHDEIPNLVEIVKGYMHYEQETLLAITQARAAALVTASIREKAQADLVLTGALRDFFGVAENYPQLKANEHFLKLQKRLSELEERIADRREYFNDDVNTYNTRLRQFPEAFLAVTLRLKPLEMFKASEADSQPVSINFAQLG